MDIDFSGSLERLLKITRFLHSIIENLALEKQESPSLYFEANKLYINLNHRQGWIVVDPENNRAYHVSRAKDPATTQHPCSPYLAEYIYKSLHDTLIDLNLLVDYNNFEG